MSNYTAADLQAFGQSELIELVLELQDRLAVAA